MIFRDKNNKEIKDGEAILFSHEDKVEPTGFNKYVTDVKTCFWSEIEKRYIPFSEVFIGGFIEDCERINLRTNKK